MSESVLSRHTPLDLNRECDRTVGTSKNDKRRAKEVRKRQGLVWVSRAGIVTVIRAFGDHFCAVLTSCKQMGGVSWSRVAETVERLVVDSTTPGMLSGLLSLQELQLLAAS